MEESAVLEELIEGIEVTVPILDQSALPAIEIRLPTNAEFNYENKYNGQTQEICPPASLTQDQHQDAQYLAEKVHKIMNCQHLSRVDMIMSPDGSFKVLEINTIPGLTDQSLYPKSAAAVGINMPALVKKFVDLVTRDYKLD
jgi:D-alanine-D-alanine ligase